MNKIQSKTLTN